MHALSTLCVLTIFFLGSTSAALSKDISHKLAKRDADMDIPELAEALGLQTLYDLLNTTGLVEVLSADGPFTVFSPTDEAFASFSEETIPQLIEVPKILSNILKFHVAVGEEESDDLENELLLDTALEGAQMRINIYTVDDETVATAQCAPIDLTQVDNEASNGVIHVVNKVLTPPMGTLKDAIMNTNGYTTLRTALQAASLLDTLGSEGPFTLFAPTDAAFAKVDPLVLKALLGDEDELTKVLTYHVVAGTFCSAGLSNGEVGTLEGEDVVIAVTADGVTVDAANVLCADISVTNGVMHAIDTVLIPPDFALEVDED